MKCSCFEKVRSTFSNISKHPPVGEGGPHRVALMLRKGSSQGNIYVCVSVGLSTRRKRGFLGLHAWYITGKKWYIL